MPRELPNLDWLRVFAATAASESFALAAGELGVTPGAVSQRIKALETYLGVELFQRYPQGVRLTEEGRRYAHRARAPLEQLAMATRQIMSPERINSVRLTALPALAQLWLGPRIEEFHKAHPNSTIEIWADPAIVDLRTSNFDVAIRYGQPPFPGCDYRELLLDELVPVASPAFIRSSTLDGQGLPIGTALFIDSYWADDFDDWLRRTGHVCPAGLVTHSFSLYSMVIEATLSGRGFMVGHTSVVSDLIAEGRLQPLSNQRVRAGKQFYLLTKAASPLTETAAAFVDWIVAQAMPSQSPG